MLRIIIKEQSKESNFNLQAAGMPRGWALYFINLTLSVYFLAYLS